MFSKPQARPEDSEGLLKQNLMISEDFELCLRFLALDIFCFNIEL